MNTKIKLLLAGFAAALFWIGGCDSDSPFAPGGIDISKLEGKIVFVAPADDNTESGYTYQYEAYVMDADGGNVKRITYTPIVYQYSKDRKDDICWSPDGTQIIYSGGDRIQLMEADGKGNHQIIYNFDGALNPCWNPDGSKLMYRTSGGDLYIREFSGGLIKFTFEDNLSVSVHNPAWSPDGQKIAFASAFEGDFDIYVVNIDGTGLTNLTNSPGGDGQPRWSPDGTKIAFYHGEGVGQTNIYVMDADGGNQIKITDCPRGDMAFHPSWSRDGSKIAFRSGAGIYVVNADGTHATKIYMHKTEAPSGQVSSFDWH